jgi:hypothetical protein
MISRRIDVPACWSVANVNGTLGCRLVLQDGQEFLKLLLQCLERFFKDPHGVGRVGNASIGFCVACMCQP